MSEEGSKRIPGYAKPNLTSKLPPNLGLEHEAIKAAFAPGSYTAISDISGRVAPPPVADDASVLTDASLGFKSGHGKGYFTDFEYSASPYDLGAELKSRERKDHHMKMGVIAGDVPFVAPGTIATQKYEQTYPYVTDPFDTVKDEVLRGKWVEERKVIAGPFIPSGRDKPLNRPTRAMMTDIMSAIYRALAADWEELQPTVFTTAEDLIVVYFNRENLNKNHHGLVAYMNVMANSSAISQRFELRKVSEGWDLITEDNHVMFSFRPPWVKEKRFTSFTSNA
eukprot:TRINITY_DN8780_c0_g1_i2.p1 TRINITY_DN8780_c0_g1~~TRINITY_DN8780_c0_g1_i2.p1  ORF type:complete len:281 (+),score=56.60 TRINITY_DN8780_c0_g1_i2:58-900(+)